jgi:glutathione peroxidase
MASATSFYDFKPLDKKGQPYPLENLKGKVVLVVNTASKCGFTPQFGGLETLYKEIKAEYPSAHPPHAPPQYTAEANKVTHPDEFEILGFPCNQFGSQDPNSNDEIQNFCQVNYGVTFPVLGKTNVNGDEAEPVYQWMKKEWPGLLGIKSIKWNFEKFLIDKEGKVVGRWASTSKPDSLAQPILAELQKEKA